MPPSKFPKRQPDPGTGVEIAKTSRKSVGNAIGRKFLLELKNNIQMNVDSPERRILAEIILWKISLIFIGEENQENLQWAIDYAADIWAIYPDLQGKYSALNQVTLHPSGENLHALAVWLQPENKPRLPANAAEYLNVDQ